MPQGGTEMQQEPDAQLRMPQEPGRRPLPWRWLELDSVAIAGDADDLPNHCAEGHRGVERRDTIAPGEEVIVSHLEQHDGQ